MSGFVPFLSIWFHIQEMPMLMDQINHIQEMPMLMDQINHTIAQPAKPNQLFP